MLTSQRRRLILDTLARDGEVIAKRLSAEFSLSEDTIRRDLRELAAEGLLQRVHGGALPASPTVVAIDRRAAMAPEAKARLGRAGAAMIQQGQTVFLDGGTTNAALVQALPPGLAFTAITHSPTIAVALEAHPQVETILVGGRLFRHSMVATGALALEAIDRMRADLFFLGATGVHEEHGLTTGDMEEAAVKRAIVGRCAETVVLATAEKLRAVSPFRIVPLTSIATLVVPAEADAPVRDALSSGGVSVVAV